VIPLQQFSGQKVQMMKETAKKESGCSKHKIISAMSEQAMLKRFASDEDCLEYLAGEKWKDGFNCRKCGHTNWCKGKAPYSRRCTKCKHEESACSHTFFHHCKIPLKDAFRIAWLVCHQPDISSYELSRRFNIRQMTCWRFKKRVCECLEEKGEFGVV